MQPLDWRPPRSQTAAIFTTRSCGAYSEINQAFETADSETLKSLTTDNHVSVTPSGQKDTPVWKRFGDPGLTDFKRKVVSDVVVEELAPGVVMQRFDAAMQGSFNDVTIPDRAAITIIWQQHEGAWRERFYQHTPLDD